MKTKLAAAAIALCLSAPAMAAFTITLTEVNGDVVANGSGSINTTTLTPHLLYGNLTEIRPDIGFLILNTSLARSYIAVSGPTSFGNGFGQIAATSNSGDNVGIYADASQILVPTGYTSMDPLTASATWSGATFASLGLTSGTYDWTWGTGSDADKFTVQIGPLAAPAATTSIPTLSEWGLIGLSSILAMFGLSRMRRRQR